MSKKLIYFSYYLKEKNLIFIRRKNNFVQVSKNLVIIEKNLQ